MATSPTANTNFKVYIAIDFGTDGLGLAYAINEEDVYIHSKWNSKKYEHVVKPKTIILLDDKGDAVSFGMDAKFTYMNLSTKQRNEWMLFERFKMSLYEDQLYEDQQDEEFKDQQEDDIKESLSLKRSHKKYEIKSDEFDSEFINKIESTTKRIKIKNELTAINGKTYSADKVFIKVFQYIKKEAKKYLRKKKIKNICDDEIGWIITVPAIWNDESKNKMKEWATAAKLINKNILNQCKIVYEPDCASLAIRKKIQNNNEMKVGDKYILIDAGGGTVDIACHVCINGFSVKEILPPSGGKWGSSYIDDQYIKLLQNIFTINWVNEFKLLSPNIFVEIIHNFQQAKSLFYLNTNEKYTNVRLPIDFICFIDEKIDNNNNNNNINDIDEFVNKYCILGQSKSICLEDEYLHIDNIVWKSMFDHCINPTIMHIMKLLRHEQMKECIYLCLVGGLSCSPYFQFKMRHQFGEGTKYNLRIIIPARPMLSVVEGAAYLGINQQYIRARRLRLTYGFVVNKPIDIAKEMGINNEYIEENKYFDENNDEYMVPGCFHIMAKKNQEVQLDHVFIETSFRSDCKNMKVKSQIFSSEMDNPLTVEDGQELVEYTVLFKNKNDIEIIDEFHFYDTMLKVYSYSKNEPNIKTEVQLSYN